MQHTTFRWLVPAFRTVPTLARQALLLVSCMAGVVLLSGCEEGPTKKGKPYRALHIQDPGNYVRNYWQAYTAYAAVLHQKTELQTPLERLRSQARQDSIRQLPRTHERQNQLAQLRGFVNAQQEEQLQRNAHTAYLAAVKANPTFFKKSWQQRMKWLLLVQASHSAPQPNPSY